MLTDDAPPALELEPLSRGCVALAEHAGRLIMEVYRRDFDVERKQDQTPVTEADVRAEKAILLGLSRLAPDIPVVAEERFSAGLGPAESSDVFFLVDPLDGTREFVKRNGEFTVNIALIGMGVPLMGVVHLPALGETYWSDGARAWQTGANATARAIRCSEPAIEGLRVLTSRSHRDDRVDAFLRPLRIKQTVFAGSSLKFCHLARGDADLYPRFGRTMEWDTAAGHAVLRAAGGEVVCLDGAPLGYGKDGFENPDFIARSDFDLTRFAA